MKCPHCGKDIFPGQFICDHCHKVVKVEEKKNKGEEKNGK